jgi:hypothetical protein
MSAAVGTSNISFSGLQTSWSNASFAGGSDPGTTNISLSEFAGATFTNSSSVPTGGATISISSHFSGLTFGSGGGGRGGRSDKRLKENIEFIKKSKSGIPIYHFNYLPLYTEDLGLDITKRYQGVLAQDLIELDMKAAVITDKRGFYEVLYDEIDVDLVEV